MASSSVSPYALTNLAGMAGQSSLMRESGGQLYVIVGGTTLKPSAFSMTYGLNSIPTATA